MMKKLLLFFSISVFFIGRSTAQELTKERSKESFIEWNFGIAFLEDEDFVFPGTSVLWGKTYINENDLIFEYEVGFALPTLVTGKIGIGKKFNNTKVVVGIRPFPFNIYGQSSFAKGEKGYWITSLEYNPRNPTNRVSKGILNFGYRWNLDSKDKK
ncbi:MAG: hypothetical protein P8P55_00815 [Flavobacteriaceae bacterium]|jgi:hypothetical protein|nr:hypothetical protein [Flavobacteriaceae bacterium]|tara:strand:- start:412 stop:879 length:468 start_codon:yes stop_codon:yes gene_type:complete